MCVKPYYFIELKLFIIFFHQPPSDSKLSQPKLEKFHLQVSAAIEIGILCLQMQSHANNKAWSLKHHLPVRTMSETDHLWISDDKLVSDN